jgi:hypothetical protein
LNIWYKVGMPVVIAVLLIISAVSITLAVATSSGSQVSAASNNNGVTNSSKLADGAVCPACPGYDGSAGTGNQSSCCGVNGQSTGPTTSRGGCCGSR